MGMPVIRVCNIVLICFGICMSVNISYGKSINNNSTSLKLVAILHRHGLRTPVKFYENDPYKDVNKYWPIGLGELTGEGKKQLFKLGKTFRELYASFISKYSTKSVRVSTSDADRCHMSVASLLAGLFPPEGDEIWNDELIWQPIPIHSVPRISDKILGLDAPCPRYKQEKEKVRREIADNETISDKELYKYFSDNMGQYVDKFSDVAFLYHTLLIEDLHGLILPAWTKKVHPHKTKEITILYHATETWNKIMKRFSGGPFIKEVLEKFKEKRDGQNDDLKMLLYSAHDTTLLSVWRALEFEELILTEFGASFIFELHQLNDKYFVEMFYLNNTSLTKPYQLQIPNCLSPCPLDMMLNITEYVRSVDWDKQCNIE